MACYLHVCIAVHWCVQYSIVEIILLFLLWVHTAAPTECDHMHMYILVIPAVLNRYLHWKQSVTVLQCIPKCLKKAKTSKSHIISCFQQDHSPYTNKCHVQKVSS